MEIQTPKTFLDKLVSSDANLAFLMVNVCGIMWYSVIHHNNLPDGMVTIVLGIFAGKTVHGVVAMKQENGNNNGNGGNGHSILSAIKGTKKP